MSASRSTRAVRLPHDEALALYRSGRTARDDGQVVLLGGLGLVAISMTPLAWAAGHYCLHGQDCGAMTSDPWFVVGMTFAISGGLALAAGASWWAVGSSRMRRAREMDHSVTYGMPFLAPARGGLVLGYRLDGF